MFNNRVYVDWSNGGPIYEKYKAALAKAASGDVDAEIECRAISVHSYGEDISLIRSGRGMFERAALYLKGEPPEIRESQLDVEELERQAEEINERLEFARHALTSAQEIDGDRRHALFGLIVNTGPMCTSLPANEVLRSEFKALTGYQLNDRGDTSDAAHPNHANYKGRK